MSTENLTKACRRLFMPPRFPATAAGMLICSFCGAAYRSGHWFEAEHEPDCPIEQVHAALDDAESSQ